jgi:hypothetical protein
MPTLLALSHSESDLPFRFVAVLGRCILPRNAPFPILSALMRPMSSFAAFILLVAPILAGSESGTELGTLETQFKSTVLPLLRQHCFDCHGAEDPEAMFDLSRFASSKDVVKEFAAWQHVVDRVANGEMPPADAPQPTPRSRSAVLHWSKAFRRYQARRNAGDPGPGLARRLSAEEYNNTIRDLTGVDIRPAEQFPVDRANQEGFVNSGESLEMTPGLLMKYLDAARTVAEHLVLGPEGLGFASHPVVVDTDRDKYCVRRIAEFYERQNTDFSDYFFAAWRVRQMTRHHSLESSSNVGSAIVNVARDEEVSPKYLRTIWLLLTGNTHHFGPIAKLRAVWLGLRDGAGHRHHVRMECDKMSEYVLALRPQLARTFPHLTHRGINNGTQPFVLWRNRQYAANRRSLDREALVAPEAVPNEPRPRGKESQEADKAHPNVPLPAGLGQPTREDLEVPAEEDERRRHIAAFVEFCAVFPDAFYIKSRGREFRGRQGQEYANEAKVRPLSAGFHSQMGNGALRGSIHLPKTATKRKGRSDSLCERARRVGMHDVVGDCAKHHVDPSCRGRTPGSSTRLVSGRMPPTQRATAPYCASDSITDRLPVA